MKTLICLSRVRLVVSGVCAALTASIAHADPATPSASPSNVLPRNAVSALTVIPGESEGLVESVHAAWRMKLTEDALGLGFLLLDTRAHPKSTKNETLEAGFDWAEPNLPASIGIAFDSHNPPPTRRERENDKAPRGWFDELGNWYGRPQRELSIHANGRERFNMLCPLEFRTGDWVNVDVTIEWVVGGAAISVTLDGTRIIDRHLLLGVTPFPCKAVAGIAQGESADSAMLKEAALTFGPRITPPAPPVRITVFNDSFVHGGDQSPRTTVDFSAIPDHVGRVVMTLSLAEPEVGYDHWDKKGSVSLWRPSENGEAEQFEILRFITPYRRGWTWYVDVTDLLPLFEDEREMGLHIGTSMKGWLASVALDVYPGKLSRTPIAVENLWNGSPEIGNPDNPVSVFYGARGVEVPTGADSARVRMTVTGHGMSPNTNNAGEFMSIGRTLRVEDAFGVAQTASNTLWKTDGYLNPCRPQGGTWKFDRAGWSPGDVVRPWTLDVPTADEEASETMRVRAGDTLTLSYALDEYINEGRGKTWAPHHWTASQIVFYGPDKRELPHIKTNRNQPMRTFEPAAQHMAAGVDNLSDRSIVRTGRVAIPPAEAWRLWTTNEGMGSWLVEPGASKIELRVGGPFEVYFAPDAPEGHRGSDGCVVLSFLPQRMLSFTWNAPPKYPKCRAEHTWVVVTFEPTDEGGTALTIEHLGWPENGWTDGSNWPGTYDYFDAAWPKVMQAFEEYAAGK